MLAVLRLRRGPPGDGCPGDDLAEGGGKMPAQLVFPLLTKSVSFKAPWKLGREVTVALLRGSGCPRVGGNPCPWDTHLSEEVLSLLHIFP